MIVDVINWVVINLTKILVVRPELRDEVLMIDGRTGNIAVDHLSKTKYLKIALVNPIDLAHPLKQTP